MGNEEAGGRRKEERKIEYYDINLDMVILVVTFRKYPTIRIILN